MNDDTRITQEDTQPTQTPDVQPQTSAFVPNETVPTQPTETVNPNPISNQQPASEPVQPPLDQTPVQPAAPVSQPAPQPQAPVAPQVAPTPEKLAQTQVNTIEQPPVGGAYVPGDFQRPGVARADAEVYKELGEQKAHYMKKVLDAQPKVMTMIPLTPGDKDGTMHYIGINGYNIWVRKGVFVLVPDQVARLIAESFNLTYEAGKADEIGASAAKRDALL